MVRCGGNSRVPHRAGDAQVLILHHQLAVWPQGTRLTSLSPLSLEFNHGGRLDGLSHTLVQRPLAASEAKELGSPKGGRGKAPTQPLHHQTRKASVHSKSDSLRAGSLNPAKSFGLKFPTNKLNAGRHLSCFLQWNQFLKPLESPALTGM